MNYDHLHPDDRPPGYEVAAVPSYPTELPYRAESGGGEPPTSALPIPPAVDRAFWCWVALAVLGVAGSLALTTGAAMADLKLQYAEMLGDAGASAVEDAKSILITTAVLFGVFQIFCAVKMRLGRHWARVVLTVLEAISLVGFVSGLLGGGTSAGFLLGLLSWASVGFGIAALVLSWRGPAGDYFRAYRARRTLPG